MPPAKNKNAHRDGSKAQDVKYGGKNFVNKVASPLIQNTYHTSQYISNGCNPDDLARLKEQFRKFGTGREQLEYLKALCESELTKKAAEAAMKAAKKAIETTTEAAKKAAADTIKKATDEATK